MFYLLQFFSDYNQSYTALKSMLNSIIIILFKYLHILLLFFSSISEDGLFDEFVLIHKVKTNIYTHEKVIDSSNMA